MKAIFKREVKSYFTGMIGWVVAAVSLFFLGLYYTNRNLLYASSDFASVLYTMTMILLFLLPAISMRSFAAVSYTHLDVYKRQVQIPSSAPKSSNVCSGIFCFSDLSGITSIVPRTVGADSISARGALPLLQTSRVAGEH